MNLVKMLRASTGLTQEEFGKPLGLTQKQIHDLEKYSAKTIRFDVLTALKDHYGFDLNCFATGQLENQKHETINREIENQIEEIRTNLRKCSHNQKRIIRASLEIILLEKINGV